MSKVYDVQMYVDGSCLGNPGSGGYCAILIYNDQEKVVTGNTGNTTNNRMELIAVIEGVKALTTQLVNLVIYTDSQYVIGQLGGNRTRSNRDLVSEMRQLVADLTSFQVEKVQAHAGDLLNERCDRTARMFAEMARAELVNAAV